MTAKQTADTINWSYRGVLALLMSIAVYFAKATYEEVKQGREDQAAFNSRLNLHDFRLDAHDRALGALSTDVKELELYRERTEAVKHENAKN